MLLNEKQRLDKGKQNCPTSSIYNLSVYTRSNNKLSIKIRLHCIQRI